MMTKTDFQEVVIQNGGSPLQARLFKSAEAGGNGPAILMIHGWKSKQDTYAELASKLALPGSVVLTFNLREHGEVIGEVDKFSPDEYLADVIQAYRHLLSLEESKGREVCVVGTSFGGYLAAVLTAGCKVHSLILRAPALYMDGDFTTKGIRGSDFPEVVAWRSKVLDPNESIALRALSKFAGKALIIESQCDEQVPHTTVRSYANALRKKGDLRWVVLGGARHSLRNNPEAKASFEDTVVKWIQQNQ